MTNREMWKKLIARIQPHPEYSLDTYYGVACMKIKKNNQYQVKLIHDYTGGNSKFSSSLNFENFDTAIKVMRILEEFANDKKKRTIDDEINDMFEKGK